MDCEKTRALFIDYHDGDLGSAEVKELERHLKDCDECRQEWEDYKRTMEEVSGRSGGPPGRCGSLCRAARRPGGDRLDGGPRPARRRPSRTHTGRRPRPPACQRHRAGRNSDTSPCRTCLHCSWVCFPVLPSCARRLSSYVRTARGPPAASRRRPRPPQRPPSCRGAA